MKVSDKLAAIIAQLNAGDHNDALEGAKSLLEEINEMNARVGRPQRFGDKIAVATALLNLEANSKRHLFQLEEMGYVDYVEIEKETPTRGRKPKAFVLNKKGKGLLSWAKNFKGIGKETAEAA